MAWQQQRNGVGESSRVWILSFQLLPFIRHTENLVAPHLRKVRQTPFQAKMMVNFKNIYTLGLPPNRQLWGREAATWTWTTAWAIHTLEQGACFPSSFDDDPTESTTTNTWLWVIYNEQLIADQGHNGGTASGGNGRQDNNLLRFGMGGIWAKMDHWMQLAVQTLKKMEPHSWGEKQWHVFHLSYFLLCWQMASSLIFQIDVWGK